MHIRIPVLLAAAALIGCITQASAATLTFDSVVFPGTGSALTVAGSDGEIFTFTAGSSSQFEAFRSGGGQYPSGTYFLIPGLGNETPIDISFSTPLSSIAIPVAVSQGGNYSATVQFYNGSSLVDTITQSASGSAPAPVFQFGHEITSLVVSDTSDFFFPYNAAIGPVSYNTVSAVPLPPALPLFGAALLGLGAVGYFRTRKNKAGAIISVA